VIDGKRLFAILGSDSKRLFAILGSLWLIHNAYPGTSVWIYALLGAGIRELICKWGKP